LRKKEKWYLTIFEKKYVSTYLKMIKLLKKIVKKLLKKFDDLE